MIISCNSYSQIKTVRVKKKKKRMHLLLQTQSLYKCSLMSKHLTIRNLKYDQSVNISIKIYLIFKQLPIKQFHNSTIYEQLTLCYMINGSQICLDQPRTHSLMSNQIQYRHLLNKILSLTVMVKFGFSKTHKFQ